MKANLGEKIRELRLGRGLSVRKLAHEVSISAPFLSDIELGRRTPSPEVMARLETELGAEEGTLRQYDLRELKRIIDENQELGFALLAIAEEIQSQRIAPAYVLDLLRAAVENKA